MWREWGRICALRLHNKQHLNTALTKRHML